MVITEDMDWISVLNDVCFAKLFAPVESTGSQGDMAFPKPEGLCERVLKVHGLHNHKGWYLPRNHLSADRPNIAADRYCTNSQEGRSVATKQ